MSVSTDHGKPVTRAVVVLAQGSAALRELLPARSWSTLCLVGKPLVQHLVERLVSLGIRRFEFAISDDPQAVEEFLGDGRRWGVSIRYHLSSDPARPWKVLRRLYDWDDGEHVLLMDGRVWTFDVLAELLKQPARPAIVVRSGTDGKDWTGTALVPVRSWTGMSWDVPERTFQGHFVRAAEARGWQRMESQVPCSWNSPAELLQGSRELLHEHSRQSADGTLIGRGTQIHPTALIRGPVFIGHNCQIGPQAQVGPYSIIGDRSVVEQNGTIEHSVVLPMTYVGPHLQLMQMIVDGPRLFSLNNGTTVTLDDHVLLDSLERPTARTIFARGFWSAFAALLLGVLAPVWLISAIWSRFRRQEPSREPVTVAAALGLGWKSSKRFRFSRWRTLPRRRTRPACHRWAHFICEFIPGLMHVVLGRLWLVGVTPRCVSELERISPEHRKLLERTRCGLIHEGIARTDVAMTADEILSADLYQAAVRNWRYDLALILRYVWGLFSEPIRGLFRVRSSQADDAILDQTVADIPVHAEESLLPATLPFPANQPLRAHTRRPSAVNPDSPWTQNQLTKGATHEPETLAHRCGPGGAENV